MVYGEPGKTDTATKLNISIFETPQTVSVISRPQIEDFSLRDFNQILKHVPGVTVEEVETDRTYYTARGFDIVNFQYDGLGVPFAYGLNRGHEDTALYEQVEVVKGATGLITGLANPSATINFIRKRPTRDFDAALSASLGQWNTRRLEGDISAPLGRRLKGRLVVAGEWADSYLDRYSRDKRVFYGIVSADMTDSTGIALGYSHTATDVDGASSGALPLFYADGSQTNYRVSTNTAPAWAFQNAKRNYGFVELTRQLPGDWQFKAVYTRNDKQDNARLLYLSGRPDRRTGRGLLGFASDYRNVTKQTIIDVFASGSFPFGGRDHELAAGYQTADIKLTGGSLYASQLRNSPIGGDWPAGTPPRPEFDTKRDDATTDWGWQHDSFYLSSRLNITDTLSVLLGARAVKISQDGINYGASQKAAASENVPYLGVTYSPLDKLLFYGSYSEVFKAQSWVDKNLNPLGPVKGDSREVGAKLQLPAGGVISAALFESRQRNFGEFVGRAADSQLALYRGVNIKSRGYEIELAGEVTDGLNLSAGFSYVRVRDENDKLTRRHIPGRLFRLAAAYRAPALPRLRLGARLNWQNKIYFGDRQVQGGYALVDIFARYELGPNLSIAFNLDNVFDKKYLNSPQWGQANYGAPRYAQISVSWRY